MKILLFALNASYIHTNLAVRQIARALRPDGHEVTICEHSLKDKRLAVLEELLRADADVYGFSAYIWNAEEMFRYADTIRKLKPDARIIFGGPEVSFPETDFFEKHPYIDTVVCGEGETAFRAAVKGSEERTIHGKPYEDFENSGILYTECPPGALLYYESSRGCPFRCAYCLSALSGKVRAKSVETTIAELHEFERFAGKARIVKFIDRTFNFDIDRANAIWRAIAEDASLTLQYHFEICADLLNEESFAILSAMRKGKIQFEIGVQSTNERTLAECTRKTDTALVLRNIRRIYEMGNIHVHADLIAGLPYEDYASFGRSFDALCGNCDMLQLGFLKLLRGSVLRRDAEKYGIVYESEPPYTVLKTNDISADELMALHRLDAVCDRVLNSGRFALSADAVIRNVKSPFVFFSGFADLLGQDLASIPQHRLYALLAEYADVSLPDFDLRPYLCVDWLVSENRSCPDALHDTPYRPSEAELRSAADRGIVPDADRIFRKAGDRVFLIERSRSRTVLS